jgi:hypothetical protein
MAKRKKGFGRRCGCNKTWQHTSECKLGLGEANIKRKNVNYCSIRPRFPKRRRAAKAAHPRKPKRGPKRAPRVVAAKHSAHRRAAH